MAETAIKQLRIKRGGFKAQLTNFENLIKSVSNQNLTPEITRNLSMRLRKIEPLLDLFNDLQNEIEYLLYDDEDSFSKETEEREFFTNLYYRLISTTEVLLSDQASTEVMNIRREISSVNTDVLSSDSQCHTKCSIRLPTINLPTFDGTFTAWCSFLDSFNTVIHDNVNLTNVQRLTYLKSTLKGEPHDLISTLASTDVNYDIAMELLKKRYDNKRRIINNHVQSILNIQQITRESSSQFKELINSLQTHINCLRSLNQSVDTWDAILVPIITSKLDNQTNKEWETKLNSNMENGNEIPPLRDLIEFLTNKLVTLELITQKRSDHSRLPSIKQSSRSFATTTTKHSICPHCNQNHLIYHCESFTKLNNDERNQQARKLKLCINCLRKGHFLKECQSTSTCRTCHKKHHSLLHFNKQSDTTTQKTEEGDMSNPEQNTSCSVANNIRSQTLLSTAMVQVYSKGKICNARVLMDSASQSNFITEELCKTLNLKCTPITMNVVGISQGSLKISHCTEVKIKSRVTNFSATIKCLVVPQITAEIPNYSFDSSKIQIPANIKLADPQYNQSGAIDLLIGANLFWTLLSIGQIKQNQITLQKTKLGWILSGEIINERNYLASVTCLSVEDLNNKLERFWQIDEFLSENKVLTKDEEFCESHFANNTTRDNDGKFVVKIPFKQNLDVLGESYSIAKSRFELLEKRLEKNTNLKKQYCKFMQEYVQLKHMKKIETDDHSNAFYLPHHCIIKENSETTKLRVVFDGSCKDSNELSINELQYAGPNLQDDIFSIISRFRSHQWVITADIEKMYRQVWVHPDHQRYQRILWREHRDEHLDIFELCTVTYGTTSAPYLAIRSMIQIAEDNKKQYPLESRVIREDFYVDDLITGSNNLDELRKIKQNVTMLLNSAGFTLRKFYSNVRELANYNTENSELPNISEKNHKTLGVCWNPSTDVISYSLNITLNQQEITKRTILAVTAQLYDPLGLLAPIIVIAKLIIQELWQLKLTWDESVPMKLHSHWIQYRNNLQHINHILIPRKVLIDNYIYVELHVFSDASEKAFGSCIYLRSVDVNSQIRVTLLAAKSRVAPLKRVTLPRLELCGAVLAAQLANKYKKVLRITINKEFYWCDSKITLCWIKSQQNRWKQYVTNRIAEIQRLTNPEHWFHVKSQDNPADLITRGVSPELLKELKIWWNGPQWLLTELKDYIKNDPITTEKHNLPEERKTVQTFEAFESVDDFPIQKFSKLSRLKRVTAYCIRFYRNSHANSNRITGPLTVLELESAMTKLIHIIQRKEFPYEFKKLSEGRSIDQKSKLLCLTPFMDSNVIRVGGRLKHSHFEYDKKHPIILPKHNHFTELVLKHEHERLMHAGPKLLLNSVREKFWPISGANLAKKVVYNCVQCTKRSGKVTNPIMGNLPYERTLAMYPFHSTGVDYAGPYSVKNRTGRGANVTKSYICLFICFATKAIHLELVTALTTEIFLLSVKRFIARRGKPLNMFSDNGTNFVGANHELSKLSDFLSSNTDEIKDFTSNQGINWHFIPPRSPHFGGLWEAGIKSVKFHLNKVMTNTILTYEEFNTMLTQVESILNSRPLCPLSCDPNDLQPLTPAHFLIGRSFSTIPDPDVRDLPQNRLTRYQLLQQLHVHFWRRWSRDYITSLQPKTKWKNNTTSINVGSMVIVKDDNLPPAQWRLGRIKQLHPGTDGVTRVVTVQCSKSVLKRAVNRICILPIELNH